jgi:hypothetical protein
MMIEEILVTYGHIKVKVKQMLRYWKYFHSTKFWTSLSAHKKRVSSKQGVEFCMFAGAWGFLVFNFIFAMQISTIFIGFHAIKLVIGRL